MALFDHHVARYQLQIKVDFLTFFGYTFNHTHIVRVVELGRHAVLRGLCLWHVGSSPTSDTNFLLYRIN